MLVAGLCCSFFAATTALSSSALRYGFAFILRSDGTQPSHSYFRSQSLWKTSHFIFSGKSTHLPPLFPLKTKRLILRVRFIRFKNWRFRGCWSEENRQVLKCLLLHKLANNNEIKPSAPALDGARHWQKWLQKSVGKRLFNIVAVITTLRHEKYYNYALCINSLGYVFIK